MQFMLKPGEADLKDNPAKAPEIVPAEWADRVLADIIRDVRSGGSNPPPRAEPAIAAVPPRETGAPPRQPPAMAASDISSLDAALRTADMHPIAGRARPARRWGRQMMIGFALALCGAAATAAWPHYSDTAWQTIATWTPRLLATSTAPVDAAEQPSSADTQAASSATAPAQPAATEAAVSVQPAPGETQPSLPPDAAQALQSMARDVAAMAQQIEQLKAGMAELKTGQQQIARDMAKATEIRASEPKVSEPRTSDIRGSDIKASASAPELRPSMPASRPKPPPRVATPRQTSPMTAPPPSFAGPARQPKPVASAVPYMPPPPPLPPTASAAPPQTTAQPDDDPVVRPPMPLR